MLRAGASCDLQLSRVAYVCVLASVCIYALSAHSIATSKSWVLPGVKVLATCTGLIIINLAYHDGRIADCETLHLSSSLESEKLRVFS